MNICSFNNVSLDKTIVFDIYHSWKVSKYGVISGPYFPVFGLNFGDLIRKSPYSVRIQENTDQK